jgi:hypothetical protein
LLHATAAAALSQTSISVFPHWAAMQLTFILHDDSNIHSLPIWINSLKFALIIIMYSPYRL